MDLMTFFLGLTTTRNVHHNKTYVPFDTSYLKVYPYSPIHAVIVSLPGADSMNSFKEKKETFFGTFSNLKRNFGPIQEQHYDGQEELPQSGRNF